MKHHWRAGHAVLMLLLASTLFIENAKATTLNLNVCFTLGLVDDRRFDCALAADAGHRRPCRTDLQTNVSSAVGFEVELWDRDDPPGFPDDYVGTWRITGEGNQCISFTWETTCGACNPGEEGESAPDLYLIVTNRVWSTTHPVAISLVDNALTTYPKASFRDLPGAVATSCSQGTNCQMAPGAILLPAGDTGTLYGQGLLALDSAQRALEVYGGLYDQNVLMNVVWPSFSVSCPDLCVAWGTTNGRYRVHIPSGAPSLFSGGAAAHEMGHLLQMQLFEQDNITDDCTKSGAGHTVVSDEYESCATTEGWADYAAAVSWWDPDNTASRPILFGLNVESAHPIVSTSCNDNKSREGNVARAFWDLDDANNETAGLLDLNPVDGVRETLVDGNGDGSADADGKTHGTGFLASGWDDFVDGTANHRDREPQANNGVNLKDYDFVLDPNDTTLFFHNCLNGQDPL